MSEAESLAKLEQWFDRLNEIESVDDPDTGLVSEMIDMLGPLITLLAFDFERHGLDATEVKIAALKYRSHQNQHVVKRMEVVETVGILCGRLLGVIERDKPATPVVESIAKPIDPSEEAKRAAIQWWNDNDSWPTVNAKMGRPSDQAKATEMELRRFAKKNKITIRKGKAGAKKRD